MKICSQCKIEKDESEFYISDRLTSGLCSYCKNCSAVFRKQYQKNNKEKVNAAAKKWKEKNKEKLKLQNKIRRDKNKDKINERERIKHRERMLDPEYAKRQRESERLRLSIPEKKHHRQEYSKKYWEENKRIIADKKRKYRDENSQHAKQLRLNSYARERGFKDYNELLTDREKRKQTEKQNRIILKRLTRQELINYNNQYKDVIEFKQALKEWIISVNRTNAKIKDNQKRKEKRISNPQYRLMDNFRALTRKAHRMQWAGKNSKSTLLLGITAEEFYNYFENLGHVPGETTIDHIVPISKFDLTDKEHQLIANHYLNLRPMLPHENYSKSDKLIEGWQDTIKEVCAARNIDPFPIIKHVQESKRC